MPRNGGANLDNMVVLACENRKAGTSRLVLGKGQFTVTIEKQGPFPDGMSPQPDDTIDVSFSYDQKLKA